VSDGRTLERRRELERRSRRGEHGWIVAWGCHVTNRLHRLRLADQPAAAQGPIRIDSAPCCGQDHVIQPIARQRRSATEPFDLSAESAAEFSTAGGSKASGTKPPTAVVDTRKRIPTATILSALSATDRPATDVATEVGFSTPAALLERIRRNPDTFGEVTVSKRGGRSLLRLEGSSS
jgi:hypothetical protein